MIYVEAPHEICTFRLRVYNLFPSFSASLLMSRSFSMTQFYWHSAYQNCVKPLNWSISTTFTFGGIAFVFSFSSKCAIINGSRHRMSSSEDEKQHLYIPSISICPHVDIKWHIKCGCLQFIVRTFREHCVCVCVCV